MPGSGMMGAVTVQINQIRPEVWEQRTFTTAPPQSAFDYIADFEWHVEWERELQAT